MPDEKSPPPLPSRREFMARTAQGAFAAGFVYSAANSQTLSVTRLRVPIKGLAVGLSGFKIAFASDFHHGVTVPIGTMRHAVQTVNRERPDVVLLGGDYVNLSPRFFSPALTELSKLSAPAGVYSVPGNHEYWAGMDKFAAALQSTPIKDMSNKGFPAGGAAGILWIAGLDDNWGGAPDAKAAVADAPAGAPRVVFMHNPTLADELPEGYADLILAGHTHGWQVYIPGVTRFLVPLESMRKYRSGFYRTKAGLMYVTRGVGLVGPPARLWCSPEAVIITLVPSQA